MLAGSYRAIPGAFKSARPIFSQFGEDVALTRLLWPQNKGTYVDVGANDPFEGSNTAFLYLKGWSGLAVDPNPAYARQYKKSRPRDIYLTEGASNGTGELTYHEFDDDRMNTLSDGRASDLISENRNVLLRKTRIHCRPLSEMIAEHLKDRHVDLLNVDCEGLDLEVLQSANLVVTKPTAIIVEDFQQLYGFRDQGSCGGMHNYLRTMNYSPIYQCAWSSIFIANDWRNLPQTGAYKAPRGLTDYMPRPVST